MLNIFILLLTIFFIGALSSLFFRKNPNLAHLLASTFAIAGSLVGIFFSASLLITQEKVSSIIPTSFPLLNVSINIDPLSALFILIISGIGLCSSIYGISYMKHYYKEYDLGLFGFFYNLFILSMILVVTASNGLYFLLVWELMSLTSLFLVIFENKYAETMKAGITYFTMTHVGTAFILVMFLLLFQRTSSFDFDVIKNSSQHIPLMTKNIIFILALIGFGTKAGIIPLHIWLPKAHSAAPSQVSALMSGVMIKMGIFMLIRFFLDIFSHTPLWWGLTVLMIGALSSLLGVLYALSEHDIKRLLAYHSIENIGIILLGLGSAITFSSMGLSALAGVAIVASLFHTVNHAIFKSLLFLGAGSVISQTHTRNIEEYGGLIKAMPYTAVFFLVGSIAISGLPPFNGFASEWLTFQALFIGIGSEVIFIKTVFIFAGIYLALTGGLAAACFVKAFGATFLARPRSAEGKEAKESAFSLILGMSIPAGFCLILGVFASFFTPVLSLIPKTLASINQIPAAMTTASTISINRGFSSLNAPLIFAGIIMTTIATFILTYLLSKNQKTVLAPTWNCGFYSTDSRAEITATGFSRSIILIFKGIFQPSKQKTEEFVDANVDYFTRSKTVILSTSNIYEKYIYYPIHSAIFYLSRQVKKIQSGNINQYLLYMLLSLIALIIWARF